jgi:uncharacterized protein YcbX
VRVLELWRYPVKSMQGERLDAVALGGLGVDGDRSHGLLDLATGLVLTARRVPSLLLAAGREAPDGKVEVVLPDGHRSRDDEELSRWVGRAVRLEPASPTGAPTYESDDGWEDDAGLWRRWGGPPGAFHDDERVRVSLVGRGTIAALGEWDVRRFRPNIVLDGADEDALVGRRVRLGSAILDVVQPVSRCVMVTRPQPGGIERDLDVLRTILRERAGDLAVGALVAGPGTVRVGDEIEVVA